MALQQRARPHLHHRHPRPGRGDDDGRPHRRDASRASWCRSARRPKSTRQPRLALGRGIHRRRESVRRHGVRPAGRRRGRRDASRAGSLVGRGDGFKHGDTRQRRGAPGEDRDRARAPLRTRRTCCRRRRPTSPISAICRSTRCGSTAGMLMKASVANTDRRAVRPSATRRRRRGSPWRRKPACCSEPDAMTASAAQFDRWYRRARDRRACICGSSSSCWCRF